MACECTFTTKKAEKKLSRENVGTDRGISRLPIGFLYKGTKTKLSSSLVQKRRCGPGQYFEQMSAELQSLQGTVVQTVSCGRFLWVYFCVAKRRKTLSRVWRDRTRNLPFARALSLSNRPWLMFRFRKRETRLEDPRISVLWNSLTSSLHA